MIFKKEKRIKGIAASPGIAIGKTFVYSDELLTIEKRPVKESELADELKKLETALVKTKMEILEIQKKIANEMGSKYAEIFDAQLMLLEDRVLLEEIIDRLRKEMVGIEYVFHQVVKKYKKALSRLGDNYLKERASDIDDFRRRVLRNLLGRDVSYLGDLKEEVIVIAHDLSPSDTASIDKSKILGFATDIGGSTSHTAIMAKSFEIPAVVGTEYVSNEVSGGNIVIVDGSSGVVISNPTKETISEYQKKKRAIEERNLELIRLKDIPSRTEDGIPLKIMANIELPSEVNSAVSHGAEGIGLYRTEYFYLNRGDLPSEEEQYNAYKLVAVRMAPRPVIIRTLDMGGDKFISQLDMPYELNPFMGWRAIRFCLARPDIFKIQLRAILRASVHGDLSLMYPMISTINELKQANQILREVMDELKKEDIPFDESIKIGAMIETPSAALTCGKFKEEVDFFSIGTNDLIQYSTAVDRVNEKIAYLYDPAHPSILKLIKHVIDSSKQLNISVGMCGEMAGELLYTLLLIGLGLREFSVSPLNIPKLKLLAGKIHSQKANEVASICLDMESGENIKNYLKKELKQILSDEYESLIEI
jgi:phosphotransferase system enzyme I (PtsI)